MTSHFFRGNSTNKLKKKLRLALLGAIITPAFLGLNHAYDSHGLEQRAENLNQSALNLANEFSSDLNKRVNNLKQLIQSDLHTTEGLENSNINTRLNNFKQSDTHLMWVGITDTNGIIRNSTEKSLLGKDALHRLWFIEGKKDFYIGDIHEATLLQNLLQKNIEEPLRLIDITAPLYGKNGELRGVIATHINWTWAQDIIDRSTTKNNNPEIQSDILILNSENEALYPTNNTFKQNIKTIEYIKDKNHGISEWDGSNQRFIFAKQKISMPNIPNSPQWFVMIRAPLAETEEQEKTTSPLLYLGIFLSLVCSAYFVFNIRKLN